MAPKFSLQTVLDYRHQCVTALEVVLSQRVQAWHQAQSVLADYELQRGLLLEELRRKQAGLLDLTSLDLLRLNVRQVERAIAHQQRVVADCLEQVNAKQAELVTARQDEEVLVTLKDKAVADWQREQAEREQRQRDDIYIARAYQRQAQNRVEVPEVEA
jgi:flagellar export protein FliJ